MPIPERTDLYLDRFEMDWMDLAGTKKSTTPLEVFLHNNGRDYLATINEEQVRRTMLRLRGEKGGAFQRRVATSDYIEGTFIEVEQYRALEFIKQSCFYDFVTHIDMAIGAEMALEIVAMAENAFKGAASEDADNRLARSAAHNPFSERDLVEESKDFLKIEEKSLRYAESLRIDGGVSAMKAFLADFDEDPFHFIGRTEPIEFIREGARIATEAYAKIYPLTAKSA
jgi:hypothetical protein